MTGLEGLLIPIIAIVAVFGGGVAVVWIVARAFTQRSRTRKEQLDNLLARFDSTEEFVRFAETSAGERLVDAVVSGQEQPGSRAEKSMHRGLIAAFLGLGFLIVAYTHEPDLVIPAWILLGLGAGFLVSAYVTRKFRVEQEGGSPDELTPRAESGPSPRREQRSEA